MRLSTYGPLARPWGHSTRFAPERVARRPHFGFWFGFGFSRRAQTPAFSAIIWAFVEA